MARLLTVFLTLCLAVFAVADQKCYMLDGTDASKHVPCSTDEVTNCCHASSVCMSNGLCYLQGKMGSTLIRGSCTDRNWGPACYAPCQNAQRDRGVPIVNIEYNRSESQYCCGHVTWKDGKQGCYWGEPFKLAKGTVIPGVAWLATHVADNQTASNVSSAGESDTHIAPSASSSSSSSSTSSSRDVAIGAGVGVPLGVIALASILWALWERRLRKRIPSQDPAYGSSIRQRGTAELSNPESDANPPAELDTGNEPKDNTHGTQYA
ncbi:hypothetical protein NUU61_000971 [Penicillium alfredii]|uniref:Mid2 domain-containing protein n=1 Tax=Penicillium alfredii TaxID=1506179 RepID=A0A9W9GAY1_9EURO|nr:uncharacterized protein NUU61_000971 [Penicillium alfredii]KAJ5115212.1 hypothetical protein NUU61_000971 [Penicillium alfredii]